VGVSGQSTSGDGVTGFSSLGDGVRGTSNSSYGVRGDTITGIGVDGKTSASNMPAILGSATGSGTGVLGYSGVLPSPPARAKTGVYGHAVQDSTSRGVWGRADAGRGVYGQATSGTGGYFSATTGTALRAEGPVRFSSAGLATIPSGSKSVTVTPGLDITGSSKVLAMPQTNPGGSTTIQRISRNATANTFTIWLTATATANTTVAWFVIS
jgi:hypothetical protein